MGRDIFLLRGVSTVDQPEDVIESDLIDLTGVGCEELRTYDDALFSEGLDRLLRRIDDPRYGITFGYNPQRAD
jgi:hypothetical protein